MTVAVASFIPGETIETAVTFTRIRSTDTVTAATLSLVIEQPDGSVFASVGNASLHTTIVGASGTVSGYYRFELPNVLGRWAARWTVAGDLVDAYETYWVVDASNVLCRRVPTRPKSASASSTDMPRRTRRLICFMASGR